MELENKINKINQEVIAPILNHLERTNTVIEELKEKLGESKQINQLIIREEETKKQIESYKNNLKELNEKIKKIIQAKEFAKKTKEEFKSLFEAILTNVLNFTLTIKDFDECYIPMLNQLIFDRSLGDGAKRSQTLKVVLAYYTAVLEYSLKYTTLHPKLLILDTPRQDELDVPVFSKLLQYWIDLKRYGKEYQIIITGSEFPQEKEINDAIIDTFHNQKESGDYSKENKFSIM